VFGWATPDGVELGFSSLCPQVRKLLAETDEPVALASGEGGWRRPVAVFRFSDGLSDVRISPRIRTPWHRYVELRDVLLDLIVDRRHPLLARLAQAASLSSFVLSERNMPENDLVLTARAFLSYRGQLEARVASAPVEDMAAFGSAMLPLYGDDIGLQASRMDAFTEAVGGDWRAQLKRWLVPAEAGLSSAFEAYLGLRLFMTPVDRDQSLYRGYAEFFESFAIGLRFVAAIADVLQRPVDSTMLMAAMMLGEHQVRHAHVPIPTYTTPTESHIRGPRMADLDMTFESIC
jgi:hypothetical protein